MKWLGLIGAGGPDITIPYTRRILDEVHHRHETTRHLGIIALGLHSIGRGTADSLELDRMLDKAVSSLSDLGATAVMICSSSPLPATERKHGPVFLPAIADATAAALKQVSISRVGLVGPQSAADGRFWRAQLAAAHVTDTFVPTTRDRDHLNWIVTTELAHGLVNENSRADVVRIVYPLRQAGARAVVVTMPEIRSALAEAPQVLPVFDAVELRALAAVEWACTDA